MATSRNRCCAFSVSDGYFATSSADGRLSIWDSKTGEIKQQYTPSSHLSSSCTCLAWQRKSRRAEENRKKKKRKSARVEAESTETEVLSPTNLLALGTVAGSVLLYSVLKGDLHSKLDGGHDDTVNDVCWHSSDNTLFSCSEDRHIVEWDITNRTVRSKWKGDKTSVYSICVCPGGSTLLSAGRTIQLWNLHTKAVLKKFTGHASPVTRLRVVPMLSPRSEEDDPVDSVEGLYFMSSAASDRIVNVWQIKSANKDKTSLASFAVPDEPNDFDVCVSSDSAMYTSVVCQSGQVHIFQTVLNGRTKKPFQARHVVNVTTEGSKLSPARPIPILTSQLLLVEDKPQLKLAYGVNLKPAFESLSLESQEKEICLIRDDHLHRDRRIDEAGDRVKRPLTSGDVTVLGPNNMAPSRPIQGLEEPSKSARKKAKRKSLRTELSMEDRLNALSIAQARPEIDKSQPPRADVMVTLLSQGLQSQDRELLDRVLKQDRAKVVTNTIKRLPVPLIVPLVQELARRMNTAPQSGLVIAHWTKEVLRERASYLMTCPELMLRLSHIYETINTRTSTGGKLSRLHGKLDLMLAQISSQDDTVEASHTDQALMLYEDESSDELDLMEDGLAIHSESEGEWDELSESSDMEVNHEDQVDSNGSDSEDDKSSRDDDEEDEDEDEEEDDEDDDDDET